MKHNDSVTLYDHRVLSFREFGDPNGKPFLYFHGFPGSRHECGIAAQSVKKHGLRLIGINRPGFGDSTFQRNRTIMNWVDDVKEFTNKLGIDEFGIVAVSGGAPYALACAHALDSVTRVGVIAGAVQNANAWLTPNPWQARAICRMAQWTINHIPATSLKLMGGTSKADQVALARPRAQKTIARSVNEAFKQGLDGPAHDLVLLSSSWGFNLGEINKHIDLWHGEQDLVVPPRAARSMQNLIPDHSARHYSDSGHYSIVPDHIDEILETLVST